MYPTLKRTRGVDLEDVVLHNGDRLSLFPSDSYTFDSDASALNLFNVKKANGNRRHEKRSEVPFDIR